MRRIRRVTALVMATLVSVMGVGGVTGTAASTSNKNVVVLNTNKTTKTKSVTKVQVTSPTVKGGKLTIYRGTSNVSIQMKTKVSVKGKGISSTTKKYNAVSYRSSNTKVVSVSSTGKLTAKKKGTANITVTSAANTKKKATIRVTVKPGVGAVQATIDEMTYTTIEAGNTATIKTTVSKAAKGAKKTVTYVSNNKKVATVSKSGIITALKPGTATITVKPTYSTGVKTIIKVTVKEAPLEEKPQEETTEQGITLIPCENMNLQIGESKLATYTIEPETDAASEQVQKIAFRSEDLSVATVDDTGLVTAIKEGSTRITITVVNHPEISASFDVVVGQKDLDLEE